MRMTMLWFPALALASLAQAAVPPTGVYGCYDAMMNFRGQLTFTPMPFVMFGLIDGSRYADHDGHQGHYIWNEASGLLTMTDGSRQGWRYRKTADWSFQLNDNGSGANMYTCPFSPGKNPSKGPW